MSNTPSSFGYLNTLAALTLSQRNYNGTSVATLTLRPFSGFFLKFWLSAVTFSLAGQQRGCSNKRMGKCCFCLRRACFSQVAECWWPFCCCWLLFRPCLWNGRVWASCLFWSSVGKGEGKNRLWSSSVNHQKRHLWWDSTWLKGVCCKVVLTLAFQCL